MPDHSHGRRVLDHARPSRLDRRANGHGDRGGRGRRHDRPERRGRVGGTVRAPRHPPDRRSARVRRSALAASSAVVRPASNSAGGAAADGDGARGSTASHGSSCGETSPFCDSRSRCAARAPASPNGGRRLERAGSGDAGSATGGSRTVRAKRATHPGRRGDPGALGHRHVLRVEGGVDTSSSRCSPGPLGGSRDCCCSGRGRPSQAGRSEAIPPRPDGSLRPRAPGGRTRRPATRQGPHSATVGPAAPP